VLGRGLGGRRLVGAGGDKRRRVRDLLCLVNVRWRREGLRVTIGEHEASDVFALGVASVDYLEHEFKHLGRGGEDVSTSCNVGLACTL